MCKRERCGEGGLGGSVISIECLPQELYHYKTGSDKKYSGIADEAPP